MDEEQFSELFAAQFPDVWRFARRRTSSGADADDVAAETFAVAWRRRDDIPAADARLWLFGVARNVLTNHQRDGVRRDRLHLRLISTDTPAPAYEPPPPSQEVLWSALAALGDDDRELLLLRAWDGLGAGEIASLLGVAAATVSSRLYRARARLDRELRRHDHEPALDERRRHA